MCNGAMCGELMFERRVVERTMCVTGDDVLVTLLSLLLQPRKSATQRDKPRHVWYVHFTICYVARQSVIVKAIASGRFGYRNNTRKIHF